MQWRSTSARRGPGSGDDDDDDDDNDDDDDDNDSDDEMMIMINSNPGAEITWELSSHQGEHLDHLIQVSGVTSRQEEGGWVTGSRARVSVPEDAVGLHVSCRAMTRYHDDDDDDDDDDNNDDQGS